MITCILQGGLGNQIFQIFAAIAYAVQHQHSFFFLDNYNINAGQNNRHTYWLTMFSALRPFLLSSIPAKEEDLYIIRETVSYWVDIPFPHPNANRHPTILVGYFQSYRYFDPSFHPIVQLLGIRKMQQQVVEKYGVDPTRKTISMHFRRGDYLLLPEVYILLDETYYLESLRILLRDDHDHDHDPKDITIRYFCEMDALEEVQDMIHWIQGQLQSPHRLVFEHGFPEAEDWEQMLLMSMCDDHIIANSSFSWWSAYLNPSETRRVCYPRHWFHPHYTIGTTVDLIPTSHQWIPV